MAARFDRARFTTVSKRRSTTSPSMANIIPVPAPRPVRFVSAGWEVGVWEMSCGAMSDTEHDELCVVVAGEATVEFVDPPLPAVTLRPGSVLSLSTGMRTRWTVTDSPLRKVYLAP